MEGIPEKRNNLTARTTHQVVFPLRKEIVPDGRAQPSKIATSNGRFLDSIRPISLLVEIDSDLAFVNFI